ncbi:cytochrome C assembly protein [Clostridioides difficile]|uniref:Cytochrome C biogenesis protein n=4 Tax=Clostridioides difficile TaxID=1496 RepID=A0A9R0BMN9_CLODR|nr:cytochrome c biogenesis protein/redoxin [Clostridioides difficile]OFT99411.1 cytochrome C biogenesis protein CcsB [Clostridium sp. HMSC19E03]OFU16718.1 cytochrome C biogenesis protein CcsB [Clostridium sp. HMSC19C08]OFU22697.1 cytochrome C biogenesis protein CcsB [Clostridium sp. HMSC19C09]OFU26145.1 cytochrome C biogenesis protein CcsB [Clostridium sp. HMSC19C05]OFU32720.1 cytochrome C biogenesis protein CcsB [Clostridium sp. HMSC19B10]OFU46438.1 cytochrome C biogenesis protein CcsB [Clos
MQNVNLFLVFIEGIVSFFSPCILPILPIYLSILSNSSVENLKEGKTSFIGSSLFKNTIFFALGISTTFFILGSSVKVLSMFFNENKDLIMFIGGIIIIIMGLFYMGIIKSSILNREKRFNVKFKEMKAITAFILGFTFSFGWTPCIGPILASVLVMVSSSSNHLSANLLIAVYTIGFILPFIITAMFYSKLFKTIDKIKSNMEIIKKIGGIILIVSGILMMVNGFGSISKHFNTSQNSKIESKQEENKRENSTDKEENSDGNNSQKDSNNDNNDNGSNDEDRIKSIDFTLTDQYGKTHKLSDYEGKVVFLNFWATWCPPCKEEMPYIEQLYKDYNKNNDDVVILGVASPNLGREGSREHVVNFLKDQGYTFPVVLDEDGALAYQYGINAFPTTFIIDKEGYVTQYIPGAMDKATMASFIENQRNK